MLIGRNVAVAIRRNLFPLWSQRSVVDIKDINTLNPICFTNKYIAREGDRHKGQTNTARSNRHKGQETDLDQQAGHQCVIS